LRKRSDDIPPQRFNQLPQFLQGRTVLFGVRLLQLYIYKDSGRPDFGFGRMDHLESISQGLNRLHLHRHPDAGARFGRPARFGISDNRGNVAGGRRQRFLLSGSYDLPFGQGHRWSSSSRYIDRALDGWALNTITLLETGPYLTPTINCSFDQTNTAPFLEGSVCRPDRVGNPSSGNQPGKQFNLNVFQPTPAGAARVGNAGVGILEGPGTIAVNAGLSKTMTIREGLRLRFEATFTNVLNHTNFAPPRDKRKQPEHVRRAAIRTDRGERRKPHWTSSTATRLLTSINGKNGIATAICCDPQSKASGDVNGIASGS
jgi:hypothetical protein